MTTVTVLYVIHLSLGKFSLFQKVLFIYCLTEKISQQQRVIYQVQETRLCLVWIAYFVR